MFKIRVTLIPLIIIMFSSCEKDDDVVPTNNNSNGQIQTDTTSTDTTNNGGGINSAPTLVDDNVTTDRATSTTIDLLQNDSDSDGDIVGIVSIETPISGSVVNNLDGTIGYSPDPDTTGIFIFNYWATDGTDTVSAIVTVTVSKTAAEISTENLLATYHQQNLTIINIDGLNTSTSGRIILLDTINQTVGVNFTENATVNFTLNWGIPNPNYSINPQGQLVLTNVTYDVSAYSSLGYDGIEFNAVGTMVVNTNFKTVSGL